jgi:hypothetical protein
MSGLNEALVPEAEEQHARDRVEAQRERTARMEGDVPDHEHQRLHELSTSGCTSSRRSGRTRSSALSAPAGLPRPDAAKIRLDGASAGGHARR